MPQQHGVFVGEFDFGGGEMFGGERVGDADPVDAVYKALGVN